MLCIGRAHGQVLRAASLQNGTPSTSTVTPLCLKHLTNRSYVVIHQKGEGLRGIFLFIATSLHRKFQPPHRLPRPKHQTSDPIPLNNFRDLHWKVDFNKDTTILSLRGNNLHCTSILYIYIYMVQRCQPPPPPPMVMGQASTPPPPPVVVVLWLGCGGLGLV